MRRAIATVSLSGTLPDKLEAIAAAGFDAVELFEPDFVGYRGSARDLRGLAGGLGLDIDLYQPLRDFEGVSPQRFRQNLDRAEHKFNLMAELGVPLALVCSNTSPESNGDVGLAAEQLHELAERAASRNLRVGFEALAWGRWVNRYGQAWAIVERASHPNLGLILDSFHTLSLVDDPSGIRKIPGEKISFLQMADAPLMAMDVLQWARHHRNFPGQGQFDCETFLEHVLAAGYTATLSLEIFNDVFRATPNRRTALDAMRSLLFLESEVRGRLERATTRLTEAVSRQALDRVQLADPPDRSSLDGFGFLEFGVDEETGRRLGLFLGQLGFVRFGRHRTKAVTLYRQGDIHLVLNAEPGSDARAWFDIQGPSVCCLGVVTDDPVRAADRGTALLSARRDSPRGAQELELPAIVAPGGTIVQFVPRGQSVEADFVQDAAPLPERPPALVTIDHIAMGLAPDRFDTWILFTRAVLGLRLGDSLELADPFGLIRSSGVADAERRLRIVLNVSLSPGTRTARQVSAAGSSGGSVQHVAFSCTDIFTTVERLRTNGARFVSISGNYYDDLIARLGLDEALVDRMRALDILFDAAGAGRFFHAYGEAFENRFFFEIVQRNQYDGYGAPNAPARMASIEQGV